MQQLILNISDNNYHTFLEFIKTLDYVEVSDYELNIPEEHKKIVRDRIKASNSDPSRLLNWDSAKKQLKFKNA